MTSTSRAPQLLSSSAAQPALPSGLERFLGNPSGGRGLLVTGVLDAARSYVLAQMARHLAAPLVVVAPAGGASARLQGELQAWLGPDRQVLLFPQQDALPYERLITDPNTAGRRIACLLAMAAGEQPVIVTTPVALSQSTLSAEDVRAHTRRWQPGDRFPLQQVLAGWMALGYEPAALVEEPGTFSRRGGVIDVYPITAETPYRLELFGDEIESIHRFDAATQRSQDDVSTVVIPPAREALPGQGPRAAEELRQLGVAHLRPDVRERWEADLEALQSGQSVDGIEFFSAYLQGLCGLLTHLPSNGVVAFLDIVDLETAVQHYIEEGEEQHSTGITIGDIPAGLRRPYLSWHDLLAPLARRRALLLETGATPTFQIGGSPAAHELTQNVPNFQVETGAAELAFATPPLFAGRFKPLVEHLSAWLAAGVRVAVGTPQAERVYELLDGFGVPVRRAASLAEPWPACSVTVVMAALQECWHTATADMVLLTDYELFGQQAHTRRERRPAVDRAFLAELHPGDYVVHVDHGVGRYDGVVSRDYGSGQRDYVMLEYQGADRLYVPTDQLDRVTRYIGVGEGQPALNKLGTSEWARAKAKARGAAHDIAEELIKLYAVRASRTGHAFSPDNEWQLQMEAAFPYAETPDQLRAIEDVKADMETPHIMDRLVCGDVGYGKTEVALRAAFKAAMDGRQVAVLVPTTVLAEQHYLTFTRRLAPFPVKVELLSRFRSTAEQKQVIAALAAGSVDIVIGTHRLLQKDVAFKQLGLVVIDEEQRFGVAHKERLKQLRQEVDVLTLSATPIPRTLHMSLAGVRDMSVIDTPPEERLPVKTFIAQEDDRLIRNAVLREFERDGQVYFVHNRVQTIGAVAEKLRQLLPEARIAVGHGQMAPEQLERVMLDFADGKSNLLLSTTIIESGLDIPNANTIIIHRATHLGLAQLYQLRGRVGRSNRRAYAYLLYGNEQQLPELAERRLRAVFEASELGAGFKIAMKDLEIRGAGNLLGADQHGHVGAVGFDLYTKLLAEEIDELRGQVVATPPQVTVDLPIGAMLPDAYIGDQSVKIDLYRRLAAITSVDEAKAIRQEISDRFGPPPEPVENLLTIIELKGMAIALGIPSVTVVENELTVKLPPNRQLTRSALYRAYGSALRLTPNQLRLPIAKLGEHWPGKVKDLLTMLA